MRNGNKPWAYSVFAVNDSLLPTRVHAGDIPDKGDCVRFRRLGFSNFPLNFHEGNVMSPRLHVVLGADREGKHTSV